MKDTLNRRQFLGGTAMAVAGASALTGTASAHGIGSPVYTSVNLNVREGPGTGYGVIDTKDQYTGGRIVDGPVDSDGYTWWKVTFNQDSDAGVLTGWVVRKYIPHADFSYPITGQVSQEYHSDHAALDIANDRGTTIHAARAGTAYAGWGDRCGNYVKIYHEGAWTTLYCHMDEIHISDGQSVSRHDHIGTVGSTGNSTGPHVHFVIRNDGVAQYVPGELYYNLAWGTGVPKDYL
jgi:murein DD-endopeptidase MepM/ murein hydrolase activator NlpD